MEEYLGYPVVQGAVAPFLVALVVVLGFQSIRLAGLAVIAAFLTTMYLVSGLQFVPLTATRRVVLLSMAAPAIGLLADFAFKPTRGGVALLALVAATGAVWAFWPALVHKSPPQAWLLGGTAAASLAFMVAFAQLQLATDSIRVGAAALGLGLGTGIAAVIGASATYGMYGISLAIGAGAFLLPQMVRGRKIEAGATFTLSAVIITGLVAAGAMILAQLPWYSVLVLALVPVAVRLPGPDKAPIWLQAVIFSAYAFVIAAAACALAWPPKIPQ